MRALLTAVFKESFRMRIETRICPVKRKVVISGSPDLREHGAGYGLR